MSVSPLERITPAFLGVARDGDAAGEARAARARRNFWPQLAVLTGFWIYVALSNLMYANTMGESLKQFAVTDFFAPWDARLIQHLILYPLFILCAWTSLRVGWRPLWRALPIQLSCALGFAVLAAPALVLGEMAMGEWHGTTGVTHPTGKSYESWAEFFAGPAVPTWIASATSFLVTFGFGLALITSFGFYQRLRDSQLRSAALERALAAAHLAALRMQLSPHTLFNLLHTIRGQITWDPPAAQAMVVQLGDLLRRLLTAGEQEFSRLGDELQFVQLYLQLQQRRFADRVSVAVPQRDAAPLAWVPSLILQPLVENAVVHGLAGHEGPVSVRVEASAAGETLVLRVVNNLAPSRRGLHGPGIGLANVRERLSVQFGERASFTAGPAGDHEWVAEIHMPLLRDGPEGAARISADGAQ
ncbi:MAG TPA: histidine kinase [Steroidobacteraceae bacterium]|nr:histidine kinase [Steroidobacteraceae bacterium]